MEGKRGNTYKLISLTADSGGENSNVHICYRILKGRLPKIPNNLMAHQCPAHTMRFVSFVGSRDNERRKIAQCERAADNRLSLTRQRDSCWTDSKIESVQQMLNESERSFDQRRIV